MNIFKCRLDYINYIHNSLGSICKAQIELLEDNIERGFKVGDWLTTSQVNMIDFERGLIVTQNSIYLFK